MKIVFWGSSDFSLPCLEELRQKHEIVGVVTNPDKPYGRGLKKLHQTPMKYCSLENNLYCMQPNSMKDPDFQNALEESGAELFVIVSFGRIIPENLIYLPKYDSINLHASILPQYRGASPIHHALLNGDKITGNSVQFITKELDKGDVILQSEIPVEDDDNYITLTDKLSCDGVSLLMESIRQIETGKVVRHPQDDALSSYTTIIKKQDGLIDFTKESAREIYNKWRAYIQWPGIYATYGPELEGCDKKTQKECVVSFTKIAVNDKITEIPGTIVQADKGGFVIACREGAIECFSLKPAGKKEMDFKAFINGYRPQTGKMF